MQVEKFTIGFFFGGGGFFISSPELKAQVGCSD